MMAHINVIALSLVTWMCICVGQEINCIEGDIQLSTANGYFDHNSSGAGRVEICYCTGGMCSWSTINTPGSIWSWSNTLVACRELDYITSRNPILGSTIPKSNHSSSDPIYPYYFNCDGTESRLSQCQQRPTDPNTVSHNTDAYVQCEASTALYSVRLAGSTSDSEGVVEVYLNDDNWVTICPSQWDNNDAIVVCRELGYEGGTATTIERDTYHGSMHEIQTHTSITRVGCTGSEIVFSSCTYIVDNACFFTTLAGVTCQESSLSEGSVRLVSTGILHDRVEVLYGGRWGTVCSVQWSVLDGEVVCRELGREIVAVDVIGGSFTSSSSRAIWVTEYGCGGEESELTSCAMPYAIGYAPGCDHSVDAGLTCNIHANDDVSPPDHEGLTSGQIAGIVIGCLAVAGLIFFIIHLHEKKKKGQLKLPKISLPKISLPKISLPRVSVPRIRRRQQRRIDQVEVQNVQIPSSTAEEVLPPPPYEESMERPPQYTEKDMGPFSPFAT